MTGPIPLGWNEMFNPAQAARDDSIVPFLGVAHALANKARLVVEVGCGRGSVADNPDQVVPFQDLRGPGHQVVGIDVDPVGADNPLIDEFRYIDDTGRWPLETGSVDLAVSDWTLEHVDDPVAFVSELTRTLRPGGVFVARTVSRHSPLSVAARAVPNERHSRVLSRLQPDRQARDVFPTRYRMNTDRAVRSLFKADYDWALAHHSDLAQYFLTRPRTARVVAGIEPHLPKALRSTLVLYARKR